MKIKVIVKNPSDEDEIFAIPCHIGESGTPKNVSWLVQETGKRYRQLYKKAPSIQKLITNDPETNEKETLFENDLISDVLEDKQKVYAIIS